MMNARRADQRRLEEGLSTGVTLLQSASPADPARALLVVLLASSLCGCGTLLGRDPSRTSFREYRQYMAERAAAETAEDDGEERSIDEKLASARRLHGAGDVDPAMRLYFDAFRIEPEDPRSYTGIAYLQLAREPDISESVFLEVIEADPSSTMAHVGLGLARFAQNDPESALSPLQRAIELDPTCARAHGSLAVVLDQLGRFSEAQSHARRARELAPENAEIANNLGISSLLMGDPMGAEEALRAAVALEPRTPAYRNNLGIALGRQGRYDEALEMFRTAGAEQAAENNVAYLYQLDGHLDDAIAHYEVALQVGGSDQRTVLKNLDAALEARSSRD